MSFDDLKYNCTRRHFLSSMSLGIGSAALASILDPGILAGGPEGLKYSDLTAGQTGGAALGARHLVPRAKRIIYLFQSGGPSQLELFDYKPLLRTHERAGTARLGPQGAAPHRDDGASEVVPAGRLAVRVRTARQVRHRRSAICCRTPRSIVDELCIVRSMHTEAINHDPAITFFQTGSQQRGPAVDWGVAVATGSAPRTQNLPAFVVLISRARGGDQPLYARLWGSGFLPSQHQGVQFRGGRDPVLYLNESRRARSREPPARCSTPCARSSRNSTRA